MIPYKSFSKEIRAKDLFETVKYCNLCPRLSNRKKVLSESNGNLHSKVLFIAEAPGRLGADRTGIPLFGDKTGENFEVLLGNIGWKRQDIFITNAILCNPRKVKGTNGTPSSEELANCTPYLEMTIKLINPEVIVTLGSIALKALSNIFSHNFSLKEHVGYKLQWWNKILVPLYHPGPRALVHRSFPKQASDFIVLGKFVDPQKGLKQKKISRLKDDKSNLFEVIPTDLQKLVIIIVRSLGRITYFKLTKLLYLIDLKALQLLGHTITKEIYLRGQEGPWPPTLKKAIQSLNGYEVISSFHKQIPSIKSGPLIRFEVDFDYKVLEIIGEVLENFGHLDNAGIKKIVYRTPPMHHILKQERLGYNMHKIPVIYKDKTFPEYDC